MGSECSGSSGSCETSEGSSCGSSRSDCRACGTACGGDPIECGIGMWSGSFFHAMKAVQVDILKAKIQKAWGSKMDKAADAVIEAMGAHWQSMLAQAKAKAELHERLRSVWQESRG